MKKGFLISVSLFFVVTTLKAQSQITWTTGLNIAVNSYSNMHPRIVTNGSGNPMVIWGRMSDESVFFSRWTGVNFSAPVKLNPSWLTVATAGWMGPDIASKGDTVYVVMKQTPEALDTCHIFIVHSFNGGMTFSAPTQVDFIADSISRFPTVTVDDSGNPIVAFMKFNPFFGEARWVVAKSSDYGNTFSTDVKASGWSAAGATVCDCCPGGITCSGNTVAMLYRDNNINIRDSWVGISSDGGNTFSNGMNIDQNNWMLMACPSTGPDGVIVGDTLYSVFMNGASGTSRTYFSKSSISNSLVTVNLLTGNITGLGLQNYPRIAYSGNAMAIVWKQSVSGNDQLPLLFTNNLVNGFPASYDTVDLSHITNADVALFNGNIFVVWQDDNSGTVKFRTGTFTPINTSVNEITQNNFSIYPNPVSDYLNIKLDQPDNMIISVTDVFGQQIFSQEISNHKNNIQLNTTELNNGIYFITLQNDKATSTQKILVRH